MCLHIAVVSKPTRLFTDKDLFLFPFTADSEHLLNASNLSTYLAFCRSTSFSCVASERLQKCCRV